METTYNYSGQEDLLQDSFETPPIYAGFWLRFAAYIIDAIMMYVILTIFMLSLGMHSILFIDDFSFSGLQIVVFTVLYLAILLYFPIMESSKWQATLGKRAVNIKVTDLDGNRIGFGRAIGRFFGKILSATILYVGFIMAGFTEKKQGLHDMIAGTLVVKA